MTHPDLFQFFDSDKLDIVKDSAPVYVTQAEKYLSKKYRRVWGDPAGERNDENFISIVEITPGENENILWNFWKMDQKSAENYLAKFRQEKARLLNLEERPTVSSYSSQPNQEVEAGEPEGLPGSQAEQPSNENIRLPEKKEKPPVNLVRGTAQVSIAAV